MKWGQVNFPERFIRIRSLKKGDATGTIYRDVPMTPDVFRAGVAWFEKCGKPTEEHLIFPAIKKLRKQDHFSRFSAYDALQSLIGKNYGFHDLRHTCLTRLVNEGGADIRTAQKIAGHKSAMTTEIYLHVPQAKIRAAFERLENKSWVQRQRERFFPKKSVYVVPVSVGQFKYHVGRAREMAKLLDLIEKRVNVYLKGDIGLGKTQLLDSLKDERIIRIHELKSISKLLENLVLELAERGKPVVITADREEELKKTLTKQSIKTLTELAIWSTEKHEFTLVIDDVSDVTARGASMLEKLRDHFHIVAAARSVPADKSHFLSNFEKIELQPLGKSESRELFERLAADLDLPSRTDDFDLIRNHVLNSTGGNPLNIIQHCVRYGREQWIGSHEITGITHAKTAAQNQTNVTPMIFILLVAFSLYKYIGKEIDMEDKNAYMVIGGAAMAFALIIRAVIFMRRNVVKKPI